MGCAICQHYALLEMQPDVPFGNVSWVFQLGDPWLGCKNGSHQLGHDLGNATLHSGNECGSLQCYGEPQILVVEFLLEVEETGVDCPCLPLCPAQDIAWDDLIAINNEIP